MKQIVIDVLRNYHTQKINFTYKSTNGWTYLICANDFRHVAGAIEDGRINVARGVVPAGVSAEYSIRKNGNKDANTLYIGQSNDAPNVFRSVLVHESVHASFDLGRIQMPWLDNEAIAYIAQGCYLLSAGADSKVAEQVLLGLKVAEDLQQGNNQSLWIDMLKDALLNDPHYKPYINGDFMGDG
ncbi:MAG: hypothetical protein JSS81_15980 [Acidobacteria bacterium]|nr:hypothetical protein [Acidobacteriota bacterium]